MTPSEAMQLRRPGPLSLVLLLLIALLLCGYARAAPMSRTIRLSTLRDKGNKDNLQFQSDTRDSTSQGEVLYNLVDDKCDDGGDEEECLKGRMMSEAHLDYIYTQEAKP